MSKQYINEIIKDLSNYTFNIENFKGFACTVLYNTPCFDNKMNKDLSTFLNFVMDLLKNDILYIGTKKNIYSNYPKNKNFIFAKSDNGGIDNLNRDIFTNQINAITKGNNGVTLQIFDDVSTILINQLKNNPEFKCNYESRYFMRFSSILTGYDDKKLKNYCLRNQKKIFDSIAALANLKSRAIQKNISKYFDY